MTTGGGALTRSGSAGSHLRPFATRQLKDLRPAPCASEVPPSEVVMRTSRLAFFAAASLSLTMGGGLLNPAVAENHDWNGYHWADLGSGVTVTLAENLDATWEPLLAVAANGVPNGPLGWDDPVLATPIVTGAENPKRCRPTSGRVEVCNAEYGRTGWLGVAQIWLEGGHIVQGTAKQNDTYFKTEKYNKPEWRQFVICQ